MARRFIVLFYVLSALISAAQIDTVTTPSFAMSRELTAVVVTPEGYAAGSQSYPVVYVLHGYSGGPFDWINHMDLGTLSDQYQYILVCPDGGYNGWYIDSPFQPESQYATYIGGELVRWIDDHYRTIAERGGRAITGLSMGGHGALYLAAKYSSNYCAAATMSGVVDLNATSKRYELIEKIGSPEEYPRRWEQSSVVNLTAIYNASGMELMVDCGVDDQFIAANRDLHQRLLASGVEHNYIERPGGHSWDYWVNALPDHLEFFSNYLANVPVKKTSDPKAEHLMALMNTAIADSAWPGGVLLAQYQGNTIVFDAAGFHTYARETRTRTDEIFDLASITKVIATTSAAMKLYENGKLDLDQKVVTYIPEFRGKRLIRDRVKKQVTVRHLLTHTSGLPPFKSFYKIDGTVANRLKAINNTSLKRKPGLETVYSDIGIITLGKIIERQIGMGLNVYVDQEIFKPLGMKSTGYLPGANELYRVVPTEIDPEGNLIHGYVHDENAHSLGGVAGHAGLFATAGDLSRFARMMLGKGELGGVRIFEPATVELFTRRANLIEGSSRCLGWDSPSGNASGGVYISDNAFGHTGFTGTSLWIDPDNEIVVILLTNAVHPNRSWKTPKYFDWRQRIHSAVYEELGFTTPNPHLTWRPRWQENTVTEQSQVQ